MPISGISGRADVMDSINPGGMGGTYAGNPLSVAAALEVLEIIKEEKLLDRANMLGDKLQNTLKSLNYKEIAQVRGLGSMVAVEFFKDNKPSSEVAKRVQECASKRNLLLLTCGAYGNVIRFLYPLSIPDSQFDEALNIIKDSIKEAVNG